MVDWVIRYDLRAPSWGTPVADLYAAALEQCAWADALRRAAGDPLGAPRV